MQNTQSTVTPYAHPVAGPEASRSAVSWGAVIAGAVIAVAVSAMLVTGGTGLGFLSMSPWRGEGASGSTLAISSIVWMLLSQIIAYGVAGYVAGRLRTKWTDAVSDEIYFRDTAHGFLVWALSAVLALVVVGSTIASVVSGTTKAGTALAVAATGTVAGQTAETGSGQNAMDYFTDVLLRPADASATPAPGETRQEVSRILTRSVASGQLSDTDQTYLVKVLAQRAGVDEATAQQRIAQVKEQAQQAEQKALEAADIARKAAAAFALWAFASLLIGAFVASFAATIGGRARDQ